jgi:hypothetical protein
VPWRQRPIPATNIWLAIPHHFPAPRMDQPALRIVRMSGPALTEGVEVRRIDGVEVPVFSADKTVADCFKFRNKIGLDVALACDRSDRRPNWRTENAGRHPG